MQYQNSESDLRHQEELPIPIAFPINGDLTRDNPEICTPPCGLYRAESDSEKTEEP